MRGVSVSRRLRPVRLTDSRSGGSADGGVGETDVPRQEIADAVDRMIGDAPRLVLMGSGCQAMNRQRKESRAGLTRRL